MAQTLLQIVDAAVADAYLRGGHHLVNLRIAAGLELGALRDRDVGTGDTANWRVQAVKEQVGSMSGDLSAWTGGPGRLVDYEQARCLAH